MHQAVDKILNIITLSWLTGPIFDKELRVTSRRKRTYFLRFLYITVISIYISFIWSSANSRYWYGYYSLSHYGFSNLTASSQMARIGKMIITSLVTFQFYALPILAVILLSTSISSEIKSKTIGALVSTPINSFQIVTGKILSKLLQLMLLMAISIPILSIVRVFGGVPWNYIVSISCVTLTLTIFAASLSLFLSIYIKKPYVVIPLVFIFLTASIYALILLKNLVFVGFNHSRSLFWFNFFCCINPVDMKNVITYQILDPTAYNLKSYILPLHCGISLLFSTILISIASLKVRKIALMQMSGQLSPLKRWLNTDPDQQLPINADPQKEKPIRQISDNPVLWREARCPVFVKRRFLRIAAIIIVSVGSVIAFFAGIFAAVMSQNEFLQKYIIGFMIYAAMNTVIYPASCIPAEKESRSWVLLMSTSLTDWQILIGKLVGILRKCILPWLLISMFILYITACQLTHPITIFFIFFNIISIIALTSGTGLFFGTLFKKTNSAVIANILFAASLWLLIPFLIDWFQIIPPDLRDFSLSMNPFYQAAVVMDLRNFNQNFSDLQYRWPSETIGPLMTLSTITLSMVLHIFAGTYFVICAKKRLRKKIF